MTDSTKSESILTKAARIIPGLKSSDSANASSTDSAPLKKTRSRGAKQANKSNISSPLPGTLSTSAAGQQQKATATTATNDADADDLDLPVEAKKTSAVEACSKRIRAANKKLQRIATYEEKTEALNADQQRAVASKPALQSVVKELEELLVILKAEEAEDDARNKRVAALDDKRRARDLDLASADAKKSSQQDLVLLFQFLHLHGIFSPSSATGFAPQAVPPVVQQATGQEAAAVRYLYDQFANGPLLGGHGDAVEKLNKVAQGSSEEVLGGVTYTRIKELIAGLTQSPADVATDSNAQQSVASVDMTPSTSAGPTEGAGISALLPESSAAATPNDSVTALVDGNAEPEPTPSSTQAQAGAANGTPSFLNASELENVPSAAEPEKRVESWAEEVPAPAPAAAQPTQSQPEATTIDWAADDQGGELPSLPELQGNTAAETTAALPAAVPTVNAGGDGFQPARGARRGGGGERGGRGRGGERGAYRGGSGSGEGRGRGGYRGPRTSGPPGAVGPDGQPVRGGDGQGQGYQRQERQDRGEGNWRGPRADQAQGQGQGQRGGPGGERGADGATRPRGGGRGRGSFRGGRGGQGQAPQQQNAGGNPNPAPAAAAASPASANL